jgi:hypothetical protein
VRRGLFGAAGAWDSVRPRRLAGVVVRPLTFAVGGIVDECHWHYQPQ